MSGAVILTIVLFALLPGRRHWGSRIIQGARPMEDLGHGVIWVDAEEVAGDFKLKMKERKLR